MRARNLLILGAALAAATALSGAAGAVGPWPGLAASVTDLSAGVTYSAHMGNDGTTLKAMRNGRVLRTAKVDGLFGVPAVTSNGTGGGLSPDGRLLALAEPARYDGLRARSRFLLISTAKLTPLRTLELPGEFGFDAISPDARTLYVIQHVSGKDLIQYVVRAYDLRAHRLFARAIVDKRSPNEEMRGYPVSRATSSGGTWVFTLYTHLAATHGVFVHALNTAGRYAFCIDLPSWPSGTNIWTAKLEISGRTVNVRVGRRQVATIDLATLRVI